MKKLISLLLCLYLIISIGLTACNHMLKETGDFNDTVASGVNEPIEKVSISYMFSTNDVERPETLWTRENEKLFMEANPHVTIEEIVMVGQTGGEEYRTKLSMLMAAQNAPDMFNTWFGGRLEPYVKMDKVLPLNEIIENDKKLKNVITPNTLSMATFNGNIYGLPSFIQTEGFFYNKSMFEKYDVRVPETFDDLLEMADKFRAYDITPIAFGNKAIWTASIPFMFIFESMNGYDTYEETIEKHKADFTSGMFINTMKKCRQLVDRNAFSDNFAVLSPQEAKANFIAGKAATFLQGSWFLAQLTVMEDDLGFFNFPGINRRNDTYLKSVDIGWSLSKGAKKEAVDFLKFVYSEERLSAIAEKGTFIAARNIDFNTEKQPAIFNEILKQLSDAKRAFVPWDVSMGLAVGDEFNNACQACLLGEDIEKMFTRLNKVAQQEWNR